MGYLILACFSVFLLFAAGVTSHNVTSTAIVAADSAAQQQAAETIRYLNAINDYLYEHPQSDGVISNALLDTSPPPGVAHYLSQGRVFVYQKTQQGLAGAMMDQSHHSALIGTVTGRRLRDMQGTDMKVTVPNLIPDGDLVYLN